jgi:hypothetical protein
MLPLDAALQIVVTSLVLGFFAGIASLLLLYLCVSSRDDDFITKVPPVSFSLRITRAGQLSSSSSSSPSPTRHHQRHSPHCHHSHHTRHHSHHTRHHSHHTRHHSHHSRHRGCRYPAPPLHRAHQPGCTGGTLRL